MNIISSKDISKSYGSNQALKDLTLEVAQGEFLGFLGPNGAGKTTTIRILTGMIPPDSGEFTVAGLPNNRKTDIARVIGVMPENRGFYDWMTAEEYLTIFARLYNIAEIETVTSKLLSQVGLTNRKHGKISAFSRGMKQRLALARALINDPKVLFLDEPTLGLDPQGQEDIQQLLRGLNQKGVTIFFSSHLLPEVSALCSRIAIINRGRLIASGTISQLQEQAHSKESSLKDIFLALTKNHD